MYTNLTYEQAAKIEKEIDTSSLNAETKNIIKGIVAGQVLTRRLVENAFHSSGHQRQKALKELFKVFGFSNNDKPSSTDAPSDAPAKEPDKTENSDSPANPPEDIIDKLVDNAKSEPIQEKKKHPKRSGTNFCAIQSHLHLHATLKPGDQCPLCSIGKLYPFREKVIPILIGQPSLIFEEHRLQVLRCNACGELFEATPPKEAQVKGFSSPSAQAEIILSHYKTGVPFAAISAEQKLYKYAVSPAQLWELVEQASSVIEPVYNELQRQAAQAPLFYSDDTSARILAHYEINKKNREQKGKNKAPEDRVGSYTSLIIASICPKRKIYLFFHGRRYAGENLAHLLELRDKKLEPPIQMKDASTMNIPKEFIVSEAKCNAHAIRKFKDIESLYPKWCGDILSKYRQVSRWDQKLLQKGVSAEDRLAFHQKHSLHVMEDIKKDLNALINDKHVEPNSSFGQAIAYFVSHYEGLTGFCKFINCPFDNNEAERGLKLPIRLRKTSMFYKTKKGAHVAAMMHSLIFTVQEAGVSILDYFMAILENPEKVRKNPADFLPWTFEETLNRQNKAPLSEATA